MRAVWYDRQSPAAQVLQAGELPAAQLTVVPDRQAVDLPDESATISPQPVVPVAGMPLRSM